MPNPRRARKQLDLLYATLPTIECKGLCHLSCGPIAMTKAEFRRISEVSRAKPNIDDKGVCSLLVERRCSVYKIRPMLCRLFGIAEEMKCPFGCVPSRYLTKKEGMEFLAKADKISGSSEAKSNMKELEIALNESRKLY